MTQALSIDAVQSPPSTPSFGRHFGEPLHPSSGSSPPSSSKVIGPSTGSPGIYRDVPQLDSRKPGDSDGRIDDSGAFYDDITKESVLRFAYSILL
jgi:hypothetical protein